MTPVQSLFACVVNNQATTTTEEQGQLVTRLHEAASSLCRILARVVSADSAADEMGRVMSEFRSGIQREEDIWREYRLDDLDERSRAMAGRISE